MSNVPAVFVSSTCYDLSQIRIDLSCFLEEEMGYLPLLSEMPSFAIDPSIDTLENCRRRVEQEADIFVLIIGDRYGSIDAKTSKSITNLEYITARAKGIPIYPFVLKRVVNLYYLWEKQPGVDFAGQVQNNNVFEFIKQVRSTDGIWTFEFEKNSDIVDVLRLRFAQLMNDGLRLRMQLRNRGRLAIPDGLSPKAQRIALEKPFDWEYHLFIHILEDEIEGLKNYRNEINYKLRFKQLNYADNVYLSETKIIEWIRSEFNEFFLLYSNYRAILKKDLPEAFQKKDLELIVAVARHLADIYRMSIEWTEKLQNYFVYKAEPLKKNFLNGGVAVTESIERIGPCILSELESQPPDVEKQPKDILSRFNIQNLVDSHDAIIEEGDKLVKSL